MPYPVLQTYHNCRFQQRCQICLDEWIQPGETIIKVQMPNGSTGWAKPDCPERFVEKKRKPDTIYFGKHAGKSYVDLVRCNPDYVTWILEVDSPDQKMAHFKKWYCDQMQKMECGQMRQVDGITDNEMRARGRVEGAEASEWENLTRSLDGCRDNIVTIHLRLGQIRSHTPRTRRLEEHMDRICCSFARECAGLKVDKLVFRDGEARKKHLFFMNKSIDDKCKKHLKDQYLQDTKLKSEGVKVEFVSSDDVADAQEQATVYA